MRIQQQLFDLIQSVTGRRELLTVPRPLAAFMGSLEGGLFLSQLLYWSDRSTAPGGRHGWFYKSFPDWEAETMLSAYKVRKYTDICQQRGFLDIDVRQINGLFVTHYRLRLDRLQQQLLAYLSDDAPQKFAGDPPKNSPPFVKNSPHDPPKNEGRPREKSDDPPEKFAGPPEKIHGSSLTETTTESMAKKTAKNTTESTGPPPSFRAADWQDVLAELRNQLPVATFEHALQRCRYLRRDGDLILLAARNPYAADAINHRLRPVVERTLNGWLRAGGLAGRPLHIRAVSRKLIPAEPPAS